MDPATSTIFVAAVTGTLTALSPLGTPLWQCSLGAQVFAPLCFMGPFSQIAALVKGEAATESANKDFWCC